jgi:hypothetical protein
MTTFALVACVAEELKVQKLVPTHESRNVTRFLYLYRLLPLSSR